MKTLMLCSLLALPAVASADKNFTASGSHDCGSDPVVNITTGKGTFTLTGACESVNISGGDNKLSIASVGELNISGSGNTVDTVELGGANATGANNKVTYQKAQKGTKPDWNAVGTGHSLTKKKAPAKPADKPTDKPAEKGGKKS